jgi:predicted HAD superfamily Cof-like phosphohydrolase
MLVREFHEKFGLVVAGHPQVPDRDTVMLRISLIAEEYNEVMAHLRALSARTEMSTQDQLEILTELVKELADLRYVIDGTAVSLGLPLDEVFEEVHRANMTKVWPDGSVRRRKDGKILKPPTFKAADISSLMGLYEGSADEVEDRPA